ncbi:MAG: 30S ribosome-binding factor RbfA [Deltaproteobacteria bacterium]|nr:30S ribosome-binding factor RbfA [Deltaproteobacteria bacterium]MBW2051958.1 30S ribosome-binding factor RbfA [Deltaproteobacteria bacterium]MBW2140494.1 30S ribosome-binding factor RbfA [Deltaproteobacteria bacterium]MBW2322347.1 30S ribosome-binding factor RbfA [Deltaproteobacteria bacterium]
MSTRRVARVQGLIMEEISHLLLAKAKDPRLRMITVTKVEVSPDLKRARVYYSFFGQDVNRASVKRTLEGSAGFFRREIGRKVDLKFTPEIIFQFDESLEYSQHMDEVFKRLHETDAIKPDAE